MKRSQGGVQRAVKARSGGEGHQNGGPKQSCPKPWQLRQTDGREGMCGKINVLGPFPRARKKVPTKAGGICLERNWLWQDSMGLNPMKQAVLRKRHYGWATPRWIHSQTPTFLFSQQPFLALCKANHKIAVNHLWSACDVLSSTFRNLLAWPHLVYTSFLWGRDFYYPLLMMREWSLRGETKIIQLECSRARTWIHDFLQLETSDQLNSSATVKRILD